MDWAGRSLARFQMSALQFLISNLPKKNALQFPSTYTSVFSPRTGVLAVFPGCHYQLVASGLSRSIWCLACARMSCRIWPEGLFLDRQVNKAVQKNLLYHPSMYICKLALAAVGSPKVQILGLYQIKPRLTPPSDQLTTSTFLSMALARE